MTYSYPQVIHLYLKLNMLEYRDKLYNTPTVFKKVEVVRYKF